MPFAADDFRDFIQLVEQHPEWRAELRRHVLSDELLELPSVVRQLADDLVQLTARVDQLTARLEDLAAAIDQLTAQVSALASELGALTRSHEALRHEVGALSELVGARAEMDAERVLIRVLQEKGYELLDRPGPIDALDGEVDVVAQVRDAMGGRFWVLVEAKARLRRGDVRGWDRRIQDPGFLALLEAEGVIAPFLAYAFGLRVYRDAQDQARSSGIGILDPQGEQQEAVPRSA